MARLTPTVFRPSQAGTVVTLSAVNVDGDAIPPGALLYVTNANAGTVTLTIETPGTVGNSLAIADQTATIAAGATAVFGPFEQDHFRQTSGATAGLVHVGYSPFASVTRAVIAP